MYIETVDGPTESADGNHRPVTRSSMTGHYILVGATLLMVFIMFLVISRTLNNTINLLIKMEYSLQKEFDLKQEALAVRRIMEEEMREQEEKSKEEEGGG